MFSSYILLYTNLTSFIDKSYKKYSIKILYLVIFIYFASI